MNGLFKANGIDHTPTGEQQANKEARGSVDISANRIDDAPAEERQTNKEERTSKSKWGKSINERFKANGNHHTQQRANEGARASVGRSKRTGLITYSLRDDERTRRRGVGEPLKANGIDNAPAEQHKRTRR
jgi:hypothetical protein